MKNLLLVITLLLIPTLSFANPSPAKQYEQSRGTEAPVDGVWHVYDRKGTLTREEHYKNYRLDGEVKDFYPSGALKAISQYVDGFRQGPVRTFYEDGTLESEGTYVDNNIDGLLVHYFKTGEVESEAHYKVGNLNGDKKVYFKSGAIKQLQHFNKGMLNGTVLTYNEAGQIELEENYDAGALISRKQYNADNIDAGISVPQVPVKAPQAEKKLSPEPSLTPAKK